MSAKRVRIKICGITSVAAAEHAASAGCDAIGLVFYSKSPRAIDDLDLAREIALSVGPFVTVTGLFVNPEQQYLERVANKVPLGLLQFHGDESAEFCEQFNRPYIKAVRMKAEVNLETELQNYSSAQGLLLDAYKPGIPGGTGETFDWQRVPKSHSKIVLAGGLKPDNVAQALTQVQAWAVDVSGGVESAPGIKSAEKVEQFIARVRATTLEQAGIDSE